MKPSERIEELMNAQGPIVRLQDASGLSRLTQAVLDYLDEQHATTTAPEQTIPAEWRSDS